MIPQDQYYTPPQLADKIARLLPEGVDKVVDLAAGGGSLLEAVERRSSRTSHFVGADIDLRAVQLLKRRHPHWLISQANSINPNSYRSSSAFRSGPRTFDAAILNPPFSYRGASRINVQHQGKTYMVTPATAFLAHSLNWIRPDGLVLAIVPENVMSISGDAALWDSWASNFSVEVIEVLDRNTFLNARTKTMIVRLDLSAPPIRSRTDLRARRQLHPTDWPWNACTCVQLIRGRVPVHRTADLADVAGAPFIHTTNMRDGLLAASHLRLGDFLASSGPFVLLPRIGTPTIEKVTIAEVGRVVLSDCVFGIRPADPRALLPLYELIFRNFADLTGQYLGSCALYLTVDRLLNWLLSQGLNPHKVGAGEVSGCDCLSQPNIALA